MAKGPKPLGLRVRLLRHIYMNTERGCWIWTGHKLANGYGQIGKGWTKGGNYLAHRASWMAHIGPIPKGMCVCHKCDTRDCVNPDHLFLGTHSDNMKDMHSKGRWKSGDRKGSKNSFAKLTEKQARIIKYGHKPAAQYAREFGVAPITAQQCRSGHRWKHI